MNELFESPAQKVWQCQPLEGIKMSTEEIRRRAGKLERRVWWRNAREYGAALLGVALWTTFLFKTHDLWFRLAYALFVAGIVWIVIQLHRRASYRSIPFAADTLSSLRFYRTELERQRDALNNVWPWYLAPLVPAFAVFTIVDAIAHPYPWKWAELALLDVLMIAFFYGTWKLNRAAARRLQRMIDELERAC